MNGFVADPDWSWWIIFYFFAGGIAAGAYFTATLIELRGREDTREVARQGYLIAFPLIVLCGLFLTLDLSQPQRFWHMLFRSEVVDRAVAEGWPLRSNTWRLMGEAPLLKYWSPMSAGSWALTVFGLCSGLSFLGSVHSTGRLARLLRRSLLARLLQLMGCAVGFFVAAYTGALLTATNQPLWSDTDWLAPLFLTSAASTGISTLILLCRYRRVASARVLDDLARADLWALGLEVVVFGLFCASLGDLLPPVWETQHGKLLLAGVLGLGIMLPLLLTFMPGRTRQGIIVLASLCALAGGFLLRYAIVNTSTELLRRGPNQLSADAQPGWAFEKTLPFSMPVMSPEDGRPPLGLGADPSNRSDPENPAAVTPRSKRGSAQP